MLRRSTVVIAILVLSVLGVITVVLMGSERASATRSTKGSAKAPYSNISAADYVGPAACAACHEEKHALWSSSSHRVMNQMVGASGGVVLGDFSGVVLSYGGGAVRFDRRGTSYTMSFSRGGKRERLFRVTRTIGSRYLQEYVGVQIEGPEPRSHPLYKTEIRLPFGYWFRKKAWFHQQYFDSWYGREYRADGTLAVDPFRPDETPWAARCAWCHNTYPFELRALRASGKSTLGSGAERYVDLDPRGADGAQPLARSNRLPVEQLVTVGISCESCHLGGREHARNDEPIRFAPHGPTIRPRAGAPSLAGGRTNNVLINTVCAQCHSTPSPRFPDGAAVRNSSEALDFAAGSCVSRARCTDCHDPHRKGPGGGAPDQTEHLQACTGCHQHLRSPAAARSHSGHAPSAASCLDCHMPRVVQGLSHFVRTHRISKPVTAKMIGAGAPNACNLCHLDRSLAWTLRELASGWGRRVRVLEPWQKLYGARLAKPMGRVWLASSDPNMRIIAAAAYARTQLAKAALPMLIAELDHPIAFYRMWMLFAIEDGLGRPLRAEEYDPRSEPAKRAASSARLGARAAAGELGETPAPRQRLVAPRQP